MCYDRPTLVPLKPEDWRIVTVHFGDGAVPAISARSTFDVMMHDGEVQELRVYTKGEEVGTDVMSQLIDELGPSDKTFIGKFSITTIEDGGPKTTGPYNGFSAVWDFGSAHVRFSSVVGREGGLIVAQTLAAAQYYRAHTYVAI